MSMNQAVAVEMSERGGEREAETDTFVHRQATAQKEFAAKIARGIGIGLQCRPSSRRGWELRLTGWKTGITGGQCVAHVVGQFHDVVKTIRAAAYLENIELALMAARNRLEALHPGELALERTVVIERAPVNDLYGAINAQNVSSEPDLAVTAFADAPNKGVIGNGNRRAVSRARTRRRRGGVPRRLDRGQWIGFEHGTFIR